MSMSAATGALTVSGSLAGQITSTSTVAGAVVIARPLAGLVVSLSALAGTLTNTPTGATPLIRRVLTVSTTGPERRLNTATAGERHMTVSSVENRVLEVTNG